MNKKSHPPSIAETAFECPHCGAYTTQEWHSLGANPLSQDSRTPTFPRPDLKQVLEANKSMEAGVRASILEWAAKVATGNVILDRVKEGRWFSQDVSNLNLSQCFNCQAVSVWVHERLVYPLEKEAAPPNPDLPAEITRDYEEARSIVGPSPRGAAALLRLCIQKLCAHLGEKGKNIDADIASLVSKGLNPIVQKSLDVVRVVGNEAVHPGQLDLRDDRDTALQLFTLVNLITDQLISHPAAIESMYQRLPPQKREAIEKRDREKS